MGVKCKTRVDRGVPPELEVSVVQKTLYISGYHLSVSRLEEAFIYVNIRNNR